MHKSANYVRINCKAILQTSAKKYHNIKTFSIIYLNLIDSLFFKNYISEQFLFNLKFTVPTVGETIVASPFFHPQNNYFMNIVKFLNDQNMSIILAAKFSGVLNLLLSEMDSFSKVDHRTEFCTRKTKKT
ncbi:hypothetical protein BpHYR1_035439 [Brachionus plicatilis]|uniref:Uncharacterized protein n=1 Tax=Brachionus plicatilis TaxID=10195 RepID=A0A3M7P8Y0_BRAPC|nr:hypothetical protein BpHYR1_035439 [Brachionus plicatilis]